MEISHLLFMNDIKSFEKTKAELASLLEKHKRFQEIYLNAICLGKGPAIQALQAGKNVDYEGVQFK